MEGGQLDTAPQGGAVDRHHAQLVTRRRAHRFLVQPAQPVGRGVVRPLPDGTGLRRVTPAVGAGGDDRERNNHVVFSGDMEWLVFEGNMGGVSA